MTGCEKAEPVTYTIPKEERSVAMPGPAAEQNVPAAGDSQMRVLPGMEEAAQAAPELSYQVPDAWEEFPPQSVRKANFRVSDENGSAEIAVTVFPGDVGGQLANINRWRGQIGLDPIDAKSMPQVTRPYSISNHSGILIDLQGAEQSILGGLLSFHGSTWFFKMQGATGTVASQAEAMEAFLSSVQIEDDHH
ncbi:hypothetical protein DDZ13_01940 [Coraliomargarita sinensis]|uniref:Uncharacterized protein n=1 Tax=Coraliomargarita sinensis TaxID=2174842 RepID=A0A317ZP57_9BACT|nr:hypothetical protein DDZ13_01940 [Coraliomargarita sinensis]